MSGWLGCVWGLLLVDFRFSVRLVWVCFFIVLRSRFGCFRVSFKVYFGLCYSVDLGLAWCLFGVDLKLL